MWRLELPADLFADVSEKLVDAWWGVGLEGVPGEPGADETPEAADGAGHAVPCTADRDHRFAGGPVRPARTEDQHPCGAQGRQGVERGAEEGPRRGGNAAAGRRGGAVGACPARCGGFIAEFTSVATRERMSKDVLRRRLLLVLFGLGTNRGVKRVAATGKHGESEATPRQHGIGSTPTPTAATGARTVPREDPARPLSDPRGR